MPAIETTIRRSTFVGYEGHVRNHIVPTLGRVSLKSITGRRLNSLYASLLNGEKSLRPATVKQVHAVLHRAFRDAVRWGYIKTNPADSCDPPKLRGMQEMKTWTAQELATFLKAVSNDRLYAMWVLLATTGMRRGEVLGLRWSDIDLDAGTLAVRQSLIPVGAELQFSPPKTARGRRVIALDEHSVAALTKHLQNMKSRAELVFTEPDGSHLHPNRVTKAFYLHVAESGLPRIRLHDLRHTHATIALQAGIHPKIVSERLGHSTISLTLDVYSHAVPHMQAEAADRVAALVFGRKRKKN